MRNYTYSLKGQINSLTNFYLTLAEKLCVLPDVETLHEEDAEGLVG